MILLHAAFILPVPVVVCCSFTTLPYKMDVPMEKEALTAKVAPSTKGEKAAPVKKVVTSTGSKVAVTDKALGAKTAPIEKAAQGTKVALSYKWVPVKRRQLLVIGGSH